MTTYDVLREVAVIVIPCIVYTVYRYRRDYRLNDDQCEVRAHTGARCVRVAYHTGECLFRNTNLRK